MIRIVLLVEPTSTGDPLHDVESWDWHSMLNEYLDQDHHLSVEVESIERVLR